MVSCVEIIEQNHVGKFYCNASLKKIIAWKILNYLSNETSVLLQMLTKNHLKVAIDNFFGTD